MVCFAMETHLSHLSYSSNCPFVITTHCTYVFLSLMQMSGTLLKTVQKTKVPLVVFAQILEGLQFLDCKVV